MMHFSAAVAAPGRTPALTSLLWTPLCVIAFTAFAVEIPFFFLGIPSGHDVEFHTYSWLEVLSQWRHGIFYPRWAALADFGYGEPRFIFYPPASWTLGAALSAILPWTIVPAVYIWVVLVAAGISMFMLARRWLSPREAILAAALYAANPYHLVIVYWRSAFAELLASCLLPILVLLLLKLADRDKHAVLGLGVLLAAAWLINAPSALMIHYSLALFVVLLAWHRRSPAILLMGAAAVVLGAILSAFYLFPAVYEQKWVNISEAVSAGSRPQDNFLFIHTTDPDHDAFNHLISCVAICEIVFTIIAIWAARHWRQRNAELWYGMLVWAALCSVFMFSVSSIAWNILPKLRFMQFPWRWMLCLTFVFTLFVVLGIKRSLARLAIHAVMLCVIVVGWHRIQAPWWDNAADMREMQDNVATGVGYEGTDEYAPAGTDLSEIDKNAPKATPEASTHATVRVLDWGAESKLFTADMSAPGKLRLRLFNYPAWRVEVNGHGVETATQEPTGDMLVPVEAGKHTVRITFTRTWDRTLGGFVSAAAWLCVIATLLISRFHRAEATGS